jgi:hypothetical protein
MEHRCNLPEQKSSQVTSEAVQPQNVLAQDTQINNGNDQDQPP